MSYMTLIEQLASIYSNRTFIFLSNIEAKPIMLTFSECCMDIVNYIAIWQSMKPCMTSWFEYNHSQFFFLSLNQAAETENGLQAINVFKSCRKQKVKKNLMVLSKLPDTCISYSAYHVSGCLLPVGLPDRNVNTEYLLWT